MKPPHLPTRLLLALLIVCSPATGWSDDPDHYRRREEWHTTMEASVAALETAGLEHGFEPLVGEVRQGGDPAVRMQVDVSGMERIFLQVVGMPDKVWGLANWGDPILIDRLGKRHPLTTDGREADGRPAVDWTVLQGRHAINLNLHSGLYEPMRTGGREFARGIHVQADSLLVVALDGEYERFEAWVGVDDWAGTKGNVRFRVLDERAAAVERLWELLERDFPEGDARREMRQEQLDGIWSMAWEGWDPGRLTDRYLEVAKQISPILAQRVPELAAKDSAHEPQGAPSADVRSAERLELARLAYLAACGVRSDAKWARAFNAEALRLAINDLDESFGMTEPAAGYRERLAELESVRASILAEVRKPGASMADVSRLGEWVNAAVWLKQEALLANPLLDFDQLLVIKRRPIGDPRRSQWGEKGLGEYLGMPRQSSWGNGTMPGVDDWENEIAVVSPVRPNGSLRTLYSPGDRRLITDVDLHWEGERLMFSMPDTGLQWQVHELSIANGALQQLTPAGLPDVHNYDSIYLPNDRIAFISTAALQGVPCNSGVIVGMMYEMEANGSGIRQVCFEQDHDYTPSVLNTGRILYLRWDYTDTPHVWNRLLMSMNPDGTGQMESYGSGSYWPNAVFFARAIPGHPTKIAGIVTGHHEGRVGELVVFDPARGRHEVEGVVQRIPGRGQPVKPVIEDKPTEHSWPKFLHPWPLNEHYFLVACKPDQDALWGIYLVDVFDNMTLLYEREGYGLFEPIPLRGRPRPPVIPDKVEPELDQAIVYLEDVHQGPGLRGIPRGTVKALRLFTYHFAYQKLAGIDHRVGVDGPWEVKRVLGTVPVRDGSALFFVPARTPISLQPLDADGQALALMRSWMTAMPGEVLSCVGCHERQGTAPRNGVRMALQQEPVDVEPWYGPVRGFSFAREVQPVLDRHCIACHDGETEAEGRALVDLRANQGEWVVYRHGDPELKRVTAWSKEELLGEYTGVFEPSYVALRALVRVGGLESDLHLLKPKEFAADTSELVQMLRKGHHGVELDREAWDKLYTWIDLNAPCQGSWSETYRIPIASQVARRLELRRHYGGVDEDGEGIADRASARVKLPSGSVEARTEEAVVLAADPECEGWPFHRVEAERRQAALGSIDLALDLGTGVRMEFVRVPAGRFVMGDNGGDADERPARVSRVGQAFWLGRFEVTNEQYRRFDPAHDSRFEHRSSSIFDEAYLGWPLDQPDQPVVRVSWDEAVRFCRWLAERSGRRVTLPTEAEWEYACRAGAATPMAYGDLDTDFAAHANMADRNLRRLAWEGWRPRPPDLVPRDDRFDDGALVTAAVGSYGPNAWGLHDMHGNAAEWTASPWTIEAEGRRVVRGGSWRDRPYRCRSAFRLAYPAYQKIYNVGFRVVVRDAEMGERLANNED